MSRDTRDTRVGYTQAIVLSDLDRTHVARGEILQYILSKVEHGLRREIERTRPEHSFDPAGARLRLTIEYDIDGED